MLTALRRLASTWVAKALFVLLVLSFAIWGIGDTVRNLGRDTSLARVNGQPIEMEEAQAALRRELHEELGRLAVDAAVVAPRKRSRLRSSSYCAPTRRTARLASCGRSCSAAAPPCARRPWTRL